MMSESSYQHAPAPANELTSLMTESLPTRRRTKTTRRPQSVSFRIMMGIVAGLAILLMVGTPLIPTADELELAQQYSLPVLSGVRQIRSAQTMADQSRASFLSSGLPNFDHVMKKIEDRGSSSQYVDAPEGCEATVVIVRHCEKGSIREHCSYLGFERSVYLASLFGHDNERWPAPSYIFAEGPGQRANPKKMNFREIETVGPLADKVGVEVDDSYTTKSANKLAENVLTYLQTGQMCGKVTLISWKHSNIGHLAHHLGCGPSEGCPIDYHGTTFDEVWTIKFVYHKAEHSKRKDLSLPKHPQWDVYGSVQAEGFDPLSFSKSVGDYPKGGTSHGARWKTSEVAYPERRKYSDTAGWRETRLGFAH